MENLIATSLFVFICYILLFTPTKKSVVENNTEIVLITEKLPTSKFTKPLSVKNNDENLERLSIRQLKKLASNAKIKGYGNMRKNELIKALE